MGRRTAVVAAIGIGLAVIAWLVWPTEREVRPGPGGPAGSAGGGAIPPALATAGAGANTGKPAPVGGGGAPEATPAGASSEKEPWRGTLALEGRIVDADGKPVAGAQVRLKNTRPWPEEPAVPPTETGADGRFVVQGLASGPFQVWVDTGEGEQLRIPMLPPGQGPLDVRPGPATPPALRGEAVRVVGPDGKAVPRADVVMTSGGMFGGFADVKDGQFLRAIKDPNAGYEVVRVRDAEDKPLPIGPGTWKSGGEPVLTLPVGKSLEGVVIDPDGKGVAGAEVRAGPPTQGPITPISYGRALTDASGRFRLVSLGEGPYRLTAMPLPPYLPAEPVDAAIGTSDTKLRVVRGLEADVTVLDFAGVPVSGAVVTATGMTRSGAIPPGSGQQVTDTSGRAHVSQLDPAVKYSLLITPPRSRGDLGSHQAPHWDPADLTVRLARAWRLFGTVRREDGAAKRSTVFLKQRDGKWRPAASSLHDGSFEMPGQAEGPWVLAAGPSFRGPMGAEVLVTDSSLPVELVAPRETTPTPTPNPPK